MSARSHLSRIVRRLVERAPFAVIARGGVQQWVSQAPRLAAKFYPYRPEGTCYVLPRLTDRGTEGLPVPPKPLWLGYASTPEQYLESGRRRATRMEEILQASSFTLEPQFRILDFGCASAIMLRWFENIATCGEAWGVDIAGASIVWCQQYLSPPFKFATTSSFPYLPFEDRYFDFIYAGSVFTHIADLAEAWLLELRRIVRPGGRLFITIQDDRFLEAVMERPRSEQRRDLAQRLRSYDKETNFLSTGFSMLVIDRVPGHGARGQAHVFYDTEYLHRHWGNFFTAISIVPNALGGDQAGVVLQR